MENLLENRPDLTRAKLERTRDKTLSGRNATPFHGLKTDVQIVIWVVTLLAFGGPIPAIVATFRLDERTVAHWQQRSGLHCQKVHEALVQ